MPDASHTLRACTSPLYRQAQFRKMFTTLFEYQDEFLEWEAKLEAAQKRILEHRELLGADKTVREVILTEFSFWSHPFNPLKAPLLEFLVVLPAVVVMLKEIAEDGRDIKAQARAVHALEQITGQFVLDTGLVCDYTVLAAHLIIAFDEHDKDPATTYRLLAEWREKIKTLFLGGAVVRIPSHAAGGAGAAPAAKTATQIALEQIDCIAEGT